MNRSAGGLVLLLIGSLALIGYLTGNFDRWLGYLFSPAGSSVTTSTTSTSSRTSTTGTGNTGSLVTASPPGGDHRGASA